MSKNDNAQNKQIGQTWQKVCNVLCVIGKWIYRLRSILLAVPVVLGALYLAAYNTSNLPELVGINLQASGEYAMMIGRSTAVLVPLIITGVCLLLMLISRKAIYPWLISLFSLAIPVLIYLTNVFPG